MSHTTLDQSSAIQKAGLGEYLKSKGIEAAGFYDYISRFWLFNYSRPGGSNLYYCIESAENKYVPKDFVESQIPSYSITDLWKAIPLHSIKHKIDLDGNSEDFRISTYKKIYRDKGRGIVIQAKYPEKFVPEMLLWLKQQGLLDVKA